MTAANTTNAAAPVNIAVVGHTNTGKTSLIRTLLRSEEFGTVADAAGTTRHVEAAAILVDRQPVVKLFDTPGLEDASALLELLTTTYGDGGRGTAVARFLEHMAQHPELLQEAKVLRQGLQCDALLYVIDVRAPVVEKYRDEIQVLTALGKPIIPVFNFVVGHGAQLAAWRELMVTHNLHAALEFDTVAFDFQAEKRLYQKLQGVLETRYGELQHLIDQRARLWADLCEAAARRVVALVADAATLRVAASGDRQGDADTLRDSLRRLEQNCLTDLLHLFSFSATDVELMQLPVRDGAWKLDLFSPNTLKMFGLNAGSSALTGAAAGAGIDLMLGGLSLGAATALGAALGAGYSTARRFGRDIKGALFGNQWLVADDATVALVYLRGRYLLGQLAHRGHASQRLLTVDSGDDSGLPTDWPSRLRDLRSGQASTDAANQGYWRARQQLHDELLGSAASP